MSLNNAYTKRSDSKKHEYKVNGLYNKDANFNKALTQHKVQPNADLLYRVQPDMRLMNGKTSSPHFSKNITSTSKAFQKQLQGDRNIIINNIANAKSR